MFGRECSANENRYQRHRATSHPREEPIVARNEVRSVIKLRSTAGTGFTYVTRKNRRNDPDRLTLVKYDPIVRQHVPFREDR
jgi:large subunit ribosomal protein L33